MELSILGVKKTDWARRHWEASMYYTRRARHPKAESTAESGESEAIAQQWDTTFFTA